MLDDPEHRQLIVNMVQEFKRRVLEKEGENIQELIVFGSVARYEEVEGSDIDIFVLLKEYSRGKKELIYHIAFDVSAEMSHLKIMISPYVTGLEKYIKTRQRDLLFYVIDEEGVVIYDADA